MMGTDGYRIRPMVDEKRIRVALSLSDDEDRDLKKIAGVTKPTSWATAVVQREIKRIKAGESVESVTEDEQDALRALRRLARRPDETAAAVVRVLTLALHYDDVREQLVALASAAHARLRPGGQSPPSDPPTPADASSDGKARDQRGKGRR